MAARKKGRPKPTQRRKKVSAKHRMRAMADDARRVLVVAVGRGNEGFPKTAKIIPNVAASPEFPKLRAIIKGLKASLDGLAAVAPGNYPFQIDYVEWEPDRLQDALGTYLKHYTPDVVVPIATTATRAAQAVFGSTNDSRAIVFTVISHPDKQNIVPTSRTPGGNTTGISTSLSQTAPDCLKIFREKIGRSLQTICWMYRDKFDPSQAAAPDLVEAAGSFRPKVQCRRLVPNPQNRGEVEKRLLGGGPNDLPDGDTSTPPTIGLLVVPDDLVVSHGDKVIEITQDRKNVPTFFQVVEFVRDTLDISKSALGAYGIPGETTGSEAAVLVDKVLRGASPGTIDIKTLDSSYYKLWWNNYVAKAFKCPTYAEGPGGVDKAFGPV